jgi:hypothetical protein
MMEEEAAVGDGGDRGAIMEIVSWDGRSLGWSSVWVGGSFLVGTFIVAEGAFVVVEGSSKSGGSFERSS